MCDAENNPIGFLQEICQKFNFRFPRYEETSSSGLAHCPKFRYKCSFEEFESHGISNQKKRAKCESAKAMIDILKTKENFENIIHSMMPSENKAVSEVNWEASNLKNPISALYEFCQQKPLPPPQFTVTSAAGSFVCECILAEKKTYGNGPNKKEAKTEAALKMCSEFSIRLSDIDYLHSTSENCDFESEKNPVSVLEELSKVNSSLKSPVYNAMPSEMNIFVINCTLDSISCDGRGTTKQIAKTRAARQVLAKLSAQGLYTNGRVQSDEKNNTTKRATLSPVLNLNNGSTMGPNRVLEDLIFENSDEEDNANDEEKSSKEISVNLHVKLGALNLDPEQEEETGVGAAIAAGSQLENHEDIPDSKLHEAQDEPVSSHHN